MNKEVYEKPVVSFVETELFEDVTAQCWADAHLYCLVDPTDECQDVPGPYQSDARYADLKEFTTNKNGCNADMMGEIRSWLLAHYGTPALTGKPHYLTNEDIDVIFASGGGNDGTPLKASQYIIKVRSM